MRDWHDAQNPDDLPLVVPEYYDICIYGWCNIRDLIHTQYGYVDVFNWLMLEADRLEAKGCSVVVVRADKRVALFRALTMGEFYPVGENNTVDWGVYNRAQAAKLVAAGRAF